MQKDATYHKAAIQYNDELADFAATLAERLGHHVVAGWCRSVEKHHRFHSSRHRIALEKLSEREAGAVENTEDGGENRVIAVDRHPESETIPESETPQAQGDIKAPFLVKQNEEKNE